MSQSASPSKPQSSRPKIVDIHTVQLDGLVYMISITNIFISSFSILFILTTFYISLLPYFLYLLQALLKLSQHCNENSPDMVTGQLLGLNVNGILEVTNCYPF